MSSSAIDEIEERLHDLTAALREAGAADVARPLEKQGAFFTDKVQVRRAVHAICAQLERWRLEPDELTSMPKVMHAANRLEDVCREALTHGVIDAAPPSTSAIVRRKVLLVLGTVLAAALALLVPVALIQMGVDFSDIGRERKLLLPPLPRGEEASAPVLLLAEALDARAVSSVEIGPLGDCTEPLPSGATCAKVESRLWPVGRLPTFEVKNSHQAYGLLFALDKLALQGGSLGTGRIWLAATDDTPEGIYQLSLAGTYRGYTPQACDLLQRAQGSCPPPRVGEGEAHRGVEMPLVQIEVVRGDPSKRSGEKRHEEAVAAERRAQAEERAKRIETMLGDVEVVLKETEKLVDRRRYEEANERVDKLEVLFGPLDELSRGGADAVPEALGAARDRIDGLRERLGTFETRVFERAFVILTEERNRNVPEETLLQRVANEFRISPAYAQNVYTGRADEIKRRIEARAQAHLEAVKSDLAAREQRCGTLPKDAWKAVKQYVKERLEHERVRIVLGECLTPRLTENECWELRCQYLRKEEVAVERPPSVTHHEALFYLVRGEVVRQRGG